MREKNSETAPFVCSLFKIISLTNPITGLVLSDLS